MGFMDKLIQHARSVQVVYPFNREIKASDIEELLDECNLTTTALANILNVKTTTVEHYLEGRTIPKTTQTLIALLKEHNYLIPLMRVVNIKNCSDDEKIRLLKEENRFYITEEIRFERLRKNNSDLLDELEDKRALEKAKCGK